MENSAYQKGEKETRGGKLCLSRTIKKKTDRGQSFGRKKKNPLPQGKPHSKKRASKTERDITTQERRKQRRQTVKVKRNEKRNWGVLQREEKGA